MPEFQRSLSSTAVIAIFMCGCSSSLKQIHPPGMEQSHIAEKRVTIIVPEIDVFEVTALGFEERKQTSSATCAKRVGQALGDLLQRTGKAIVIPADSVAEASLSVKQINRLYTTVEQNINVFVLGEDELRLPGIKKNFNYGVGSAIRDIGIDTDAYIFVRGFDHVETAARKEFMGALQKYVSRGSVYRSIHAYLTVAVVDAQTGNILWYAAVERTMPASLQSDESLRSVLEELVHAYPSREVP